MAFPSILIPPRPSWTIPGYSYYSCRICPATGIAIASRPKGPTSAPLGLSPGTVRGSKHSVCSRPLEYRAALDATESKRRWFTNRPGAYGCVFRSSVVKEGDRGHFSHCSIQCTGSGREEPPSDRKKCKLRGTRRGSAHFVEDQSASAVAIASIP